MARLHGPVILGYYDRAYTLAEVPATYIAERVMDVLTASFPQMDAAKRRRRCCASSGSSRTIAKVEWVTLVLMLILVFAFGHITPLWAAGGLGLAYCARYLLYLRFIKRDEGVAILPFVGALLPPLAACVLMSVGISVFRRGFVFFGFAADRARDELATPTVVGGATDCAAWACVRRHRGSRWSPGQFAQ